MTAVTHRNVVESSEVFTVVGVSIASYIVRGVAEVGRLLMLVCGDPGS